MQTKTFILNAINHDYSFDSTNIYIIFIYILGVERFAEKNQTVRFSTHGSARARTAVQFKSDNASVIWFVIYNT